MVLKGRKILLGITGSIAAYKSILLLRMLVKEGAEVKVILTESARDFVSPLVLSTLSRNEVISSMFEGDAWANHVMLGRWADLMVVAPLSCNSLAKFASGNCDNLLTAVYLSATCPVMVSPAMDEDMWKHPSTRRNLNMIQEDGIKLIPVGFGELGSGLVGEGRMAEPEEILNRIKGLLLFPGNPLSGLRALVTAGPTYEPIDPVRFIGNHSTGKMGIAIANALYLAGAEVTLVLGPTSETPISAVKVQNIQTAQEMFEAVTAAFSNSDISVFSAAVADFRPAVTYDGKWKKEKGGVIPDIKLEENPDILATCGRQKERHQTVVGFALETDNEEENARKKMAAKQADIMVLNSLNDAGAGFGVPTNKISIFDSRGNKKAFPLQSKEEAAVLLVKEIMNYRNEA